MNMTLIMIVVGLLIFIAILVGFVSLIKYFVRYYVNLKQKNQKM